MGLQTYTNPYAELTFFEFFWQLAIRFSNFISGDLPFSSLVSDEIQILVLGGVAASCAIVGSFLVLRKMTMLANSLSHTILVGIVFAFLLTSSLYSHSMELNMTGMLIGALVMGLVTSFLTELLTKRVRLQEDASTGLVFTGLFAIGIIALTVLTRNAHIGTEVIMGNVDALQLEDLKLVYFILFLNASVFILLFKEFKITTFDPGLSRALGISPAFFNYSLMALVSLTAIGAFRSVGVLLVLALITGPALSARFLTNELKQMILLSTFFGIAASFVGVAFSRHILTVYGSPLSTGGLVVCINIAFFLSAAIYSKRASFFS